MGKMTITEGLAEIKTILSRVEKKRPVIQSFLIRQSNMRDPLEKDGTTSAEFISRERQSINDLMARLLAIRFAISKANMENSITIEGKTLTIAEWLLWRREVAPSLGEINLAIQRTIDNARMDMKKRGGSIVASDNEATNQADYVVNISEKEFSNEIEKLATILGTLDGQLSLKNATVVIEVH